MNSCDICRSHPVAWTWTMSVCSCAILPPFQSIFQELEFLGEAAIPRAFYTPDDEGDVENMPEAKTVEAGIQAGGGGVNTSTTKSSGGDTQVVEMGELGLKAESKRATEAVPAVTEADT